MIKVTQWGDDLLTSVTDAIGLENLEANANNLNGTMFPPFFKPVNITIENGLFYVNIFVCQAHDQSMTAQQLAIWLGSLKETDYIHLTLSSLTLNIPLGMTVTLMSALMSTKATIDIHLDQIVMDGLGYFYLMADKVSVGDCGDLFVPSYVGQRQQDHSVPWKAIHDLFAMIVENAVTMGRLTQEEADRLNDGSHVAVPPSRFAISA